MSRVQLKLPSASTPTARTDRAQPVAAQLQPDRVPHVSLAPVGEPRVARLAAQDDAALGLQELVAVHRVVEKVGEVRVEVEPRLDRVETRRAIRSRRTMLLA